jgi:hypothetical protein
MATYQDLKGLKVKFLSADPSTIVEGEVWYNSTSGTLKLGQPIAAAWSTVGSLNNATGQNGCFGIPTAGVTCGGRPLENWTEEFNGTAWTAVNDMNALRAQNGAAGTLTAGLTWGGVTNPSGGTSTLSEEYDGTNWTTVPGVTVSPSGSAAMGSGGTQTAAIGAGGYNPGTPHAATSETYDGSSWTAGGTMNQGRRDFAAGVMGTTTAGLAVGGRYGGSTTNIAEEYDGSTWTAVTAVPGSPGNRGSEGTGIQATAKVISTQSTSGDFTTVTGASFDYDGSAWTASAALGTTRYFGGGIGQNTDTLCVAGYAPAVSIHVEEFAVAYIGAKTLTTS